MCFSAEASFAASAALTTIGGIAIHKAEVPSQKIFAAIPLLFGVQQFAEGLLWLALQQEIYSGWIGIATPTFLFFAWIIWPVYVPLSMRLLEGHDKRRKWLTSFLIMGSLVSALLAYKLIFHNVEAQIDGYHIRYTMDYEFTHGWIVGILYFIPIAFSPFVSTINKMWVLGIMVLLTFTVTAIFYREHLISVWCFFAAITSVTVLWVVYRSRQHPGLPEK